MTQSVAARRPPGEWVFPLLLQCGKKKVSPECAVLGDFRTVRKQSGTLVHFVVVVRLA